MGGEAEGINCPQCGNESAEKITFWAVKLSIHDLYIFVFAEKT